MIFKKFLKGTDIEFGVSLEKTVYTPGETVRGLLSLNTEKGSRARQLRLSAEGKESTNITVEESSGGYSSSGSSRWNSHTYTEVNTFFSEDLSHLLQKSVSSNKLEDGTLEILPQNKEIAVEFTLPSGIKLFSSYKGKHANITYTLKVTANLEKKLDVNKEEPYSVINPNNNKVKLYNNDGETPSSEMDDKSKIATATTENENENKSFLSPSVAEGMDNNASIESYSARFERMFGKKTDHATKNRISYPRFHGMRVSYDLGTLLTKGREKFLEENSDARIDLVNHGNNNNNNNTVFSPGQTLRGSVIALPLQNLEEEKKDVRGMKITLSGIEHAFAQGFQRVTTIEKYENKMEINENRENGACIPFEFQIPNGINQSYIGRYSEFFWGIEAKINIAWSSDIIARTIIEIV
jgi:Arrestin (or S-antigen), N-terminal domain